MSFSKLLVAARALRAKSEKPEGHGVLTHKLVEVVAAEVLLQHDPRSTTKAMAQQFGMGVDAFRRLAATLTKLHDFGKSISSFQAKWMQGKLRVEAAGFQFSRTDVNYAGHAAASAALLPSYHLCANEAAMSWVQGMPHLVTRGFQRGEGRV